MGKTIKLRSRYENVLTQLIPLNSENDKTYKFSTSEDLIRCGYLEDNTFYIDPPGGPMIIEGGSINGMKVKDIKHDYNIGYIITFE